MYNWCHCNLSHQNDKSIPLCWGLEAHLHTLSSLTWLYWECFIGCLISSALLHFAPISPRQVTLNGSPAAAGWQHLPPTTGTNGAGGQKHCLPSCQHSPLGSKSSRRPISKHACICVATTLERNIYRSIAKHSSPFLLQSGYSLYIPVHTRIIYNSVNLCRQTVKQPWINTQN